MMRKVLVADGDAEWRAQLCRLLRAAGYAVMPARDGVQAWESLIQEGADIVVVDRDLEALDGVTLTAMARCKAELRDLPILYTLDGFELGDLVRAYDTGADLCLTKPFDGREFVARLRALERRILGPAPVPEDEGPCRGGRGNRIGYE